MVRVVLFNTDFENFFSESKIFVLLEQELGQFVRK